MSNIEKDYLKELYGFSQELGGIEMNFIENSLEEGFRQHFLKHELAKSRFFCLISVMLYFYTIYSFLSKNNFKMFYFVYIIIGAIIIEIFLFIFTHFNKESSILVKLKYLRFLIIYVTTMWNVVFPIGNPSLDIKVRSFYRSLLSVNLVFLYYIDYNIIIIILVPIVNLFVMLYIQLTQDFEKYYLLPDMIGNLVFNVFIYYLKKNELKMKKDCFFEIFKNEQYISYVKKLIDSLNTMFLSVKSQKDMMFMNKYATNFFQSFSNNYRKISSSVMISEVFKENDNLIDLKKTPRVDTNDKNNFNFEIFLESLLLIDEEGKGGKALNDILTEIIEENSSEVFNRLGYFEIDHLGSKNYFEIYARKLKHAQDIAELLLYDVTEIKTAEKAKVESKYKQKILAKIAHEFKTPLMTIIGLINKIGEKQRNQNCLKCGSINTGDLNHVHNLSNYTIILISDIIQYVSGSKDLRHSKLEVNLREIINFCFEVLCTLVECNENKKGMVETKVEYDQELDNYRILSDENGIRQIILNFVSNAVKFTQTGSIKIVSKKLPEENSVRILVEDSGIGIKSDDQHLIFQENIKLNLEEDYNVKGSGLGLSICKNIANGLGHNLSFSSIFEVGSKFWILIDCEKKDIIREELKNHSVDLIRMDKINNNLVKNRKNSKTFSFYKNTKESQDISLSDPIAETRREKYLIIKEDIMKDIENLLENEGKIRNQDELEIERFYLSFEMFSNGFNYLVVVDDQKLVRKNTVNLMKNIIKSLKISNLLIIEAVDGLDLINIVRRDKEKCIKCVFLDENMDYINGSEAVRIIRNMEEKNKINHYPYISITAFDDTETKNHIMKSGMNSIIIKPCTKTSIINIFRTFGIGGI